MTDISVRMCELAVAREGKLRTLLGSCLGLVLYDRKRKTAGLAHVLLPCANGQTSQAGKYVDTAIPALARAMEELAGTKLDLRAKIAGGANMFAAKMTSKIGTENVEAAERLLKALGIPIIARDCGGEKGRRVCFDIATGVMTVEVVGQPLLTL